MKLPRRTSTLATAEAAAPERAVRFKATALRSWSLSERGGGEESRIRVSAFFSALPFNCRRPLIERR